MKSERRRETERLGENAEEKRREGKRWMDR